MNGLLFVSNIAFPLSGRLTDVDVKAVLGFCEQPGLIRAEHSEACESNGCTGKKQ